MRYPTITFIGAGNMASSLIAGLIADGYPNDRIWATNRSQEKLQTLQQRFNVHVSQDNEQGAAQAEIVVLAVKPQDAALALTNLAVIIQKNKPLLISIMMGITICTINQNLGFKATVIRCMPNTPALVGCGATALYASDTVSSEQKEIAEAILRAVGLTVWLKEERLLNVVTALSGSGPAYFFLMMEALQEAAIKLGLQANEARLLTLQTALGAARGAI